MKMHDTVPSVFLAVLNSITHLYLSDMLTFPIFQGIVDFDFHQVPVPLFSWETFPVYAAK